MQNNQDDKIIEQYINAREKEINNKEKDKSQLASNDIVEKRNFIKVEIMDEYDGDEEVLELFAQHFLNQIKKLKGIKTEQHNLDLINIHELSEIVKTFKKVHPREKKVEKFQQEQSKQHLLQEKIVQDSEHLNQVWNVKKVYYSNGAWDYQLSGYQECKTEKPFFQEKYNPKNIVIVFTNNYTKKTGGFFGIFGSLELFIEIKSNIFKQSVERTIDDFIFLRKALKKLFPFTFIPPLNIEEKDLNRIQEESVRTGLMNECRKFINAICKNERLFENFYTFRFFKELKYSNYIDHKKKSGEALINHVKLLKNIQGCVPIELSDHNQSLKKDYSKKSELIEKMWRNVESSNTKIVTKLQQIQQEISSQQRQFSSFITELTMSNQALKTSCYEDLTSIMLCYCDLIKVYKDDLDLYKQLFTRVNSQLTRQAQNNWKTFLTYKGQVGEYTNEYQARRKVFIEKEINQKTDITKVQKNGDTKENPNMSVIVQLGFDTNDERELAWMQRYSKWQAYINKQFTLSFQGLIENDKEILRKIMQEKAQKILESNKRQQQSFISYLSTIHM